jgi:hypothetical protein
VPAGQRLAVEQRLESFFSLSSNSKWRPTDYNSTKNQDATQSQTHGSLLGYYFGTGST